MLNLDSVSAADLIRGYRLNLIRRGADGSLVMSTDGWHLIDATDESITLRADPPAPPETAPLVIVLAEVERITWDRLAKQKARSQVRFHLRSGDLLTFSGRLPDPDLGAPE
jgi:hypothetical protein